MADIPGRADKVHDTKGATMKPLLGYSKFAVAAAAAAGVALQAAFSDGSVSSSEWVGIAVAALGAVLVFAVPNKPAPPPV